MADSKEIIMYCGLGNCNELAAKIIEVVNSRRHPAGHTSLSLTHSDYAVFPDGESDNILVDHEKIEGRHAVLFISTHSQPLVMLCLQLIRTIKKRYKAKTLTVVMPFMAYRRQDHPEITEEWDLNAWFIENIKFNGADQLIVCDIHSDRTRENCERVGLQMHHVKPTPLYAAALRDTMQEAEDLGKKLKVVSPDKGSLLRSISLAKKIKASVVISLKRRQETGNIVTSVEPSSAEKEMINSLIQEHGVDIELISPEAVKDAIIVLREDELDTGGTAADTCRDLLRAGAYLVELVVTHMKCSPGWKRKVVRNGPFRRIYGGDTIYRPYEARTGGVVVDICTDDIIGEKLTEVLNAL